MGRASGRTWQPDALAYAAGAAGALPTATADSAQRRPQKPDNLSPLTAVIDESGQRGRFCARERALGSHGRSHYVLTTRVVVLLEQHREGNCAAMEASDGRQGLDAGRCGQGGPAGPSLPRHPSIWNASWWQALPCSPPPAAKTTGRVPPFTDRGDDCSGRYSARAVIPPAQGRGRR